MGLPGRFLHNVFRSNLIVLLALWQLILPPMIQIYVWLNGWIKRLYRPLKTFYLTFQHILNGQVILLLIKTIGQKEAGYKIYFVR